MENVFDSIISGSPHLRNRLFFANPDLASRFRLDAPLNERDQATYYGGGEHGYTDYPTLDDS